MLDGAEQVLLITDTDGRDIRIENEFVNNEFPGLDRIVVSSVANIGELEILNQFGGELRVTVNRGAQVGSIDFQGGDADETLAIYGRVEGRTQFVARDGDNVLALFEGSEALGIDANAGVDFASGDGDDLIVVRGTVGNLLFAETGDGDDQVTVDSRRAAVQLDLFSVYTEGGNDRVDIYADQLQYVDGVFFPDDLPINSKTIDADLGDDDDIFIIRGFDRDLDRVRVRGGDGDDVMASQNAAALNMQFFGGDGNNRFLVETDLPPDDRPGTSYDIIGGNADDRVVLRNVGLVFTDIDLGGSTTRDAVRLEGDSFYKTLNIGFDGVARIEGDRPRYVQNLLIQERTLPVEGALEDPKGQLFLNLRDSGLSRGDGLAAFRATVLMKETSTADNVITLDGYVVGPLLQIVGGQGRDQINLRGIATDRLFIDSRGGDDEILLAGAVVRDTSSFDPGDETFGNLNVQTGAGDDFVDNTGVVIGGDNLFDGGDGFDILVDEAIANADVVNFETVTVV